MHMNSIKGFVSKEVLAHPAIVGSIAAVVLIAAGSAAYYAVGSRRPEAPSFREGSATTTVSATGTVTPSQNPDLVFVSGGKVARVNVRVGQDVAAGSVLASLDTASLAADRAQAAANLAAAEARLAELEAGPRAVDVQAKQTAVSQAELALDNLYADVPSIIADAHAKAFSAIHTNSDTLISNPGSTSASLNFTTSDSQLAIAALDARKDADAALAAWDQEIDALATATPAEREAAIQSATSHLATLRTYAGALQRALASYIPSSSFTQSSAASANTSVNAMRDTLNGLNDTLRKESQAISAARLSLQASRDALAQVQAGSTREDIAAQAAQVDSARAAVARVDASIANAIVVAPYAGTVTSVRVKPGDIAAANAAVVSLSPRSALQVEAYLSESDAARVSVADEAVITLDAYGSARTFSARVVSVDRSPTDRSGVPAYKATLQFAGDEADIATGMTANVSINASR